MKYLIIDKKQRLEKYKETYSKNRIIEELEKAGHEYLFAFIDEVEISLNNEKYSISIQGQDVTSFTHIILRGHTLHKPWEYETKKLIAYYIDQHNKSNPSSPIALQNTEPLKTIEQYDKLYLYKLFIQMGLPVVPTIYRTSGIYSGISLPYPFVLKDFTGENDVRIVDGEEKIKKNVYLIEKEEDLSQELLKNKDLTKYFAQKYIPSGEDFRIFVANGRSIGGFSRRARSGMMTVNKGIYTSISPDTHPDLFKLALEVSNKLSANFLAIDLMVDEGKPVILEISLNPGFKAYETKTEGEVQNIAEEMISAF